MQFKWAVKIILTSHLFLHTFWDKGSR